MATEYIPEITKDPGVRLPSTWRDAIGKPLTNHAIAKYQRLGFYGKEAQLRAVAKQQFRKMGTILTGESRRCVICGTKKETRFFGFAYLAVKGPYCQTHIKEKQLEHKREVELAVSVRAAEQGFRAENYV